jgi:hypothetical protein
MTAYISKFQTVIKLQMNFVYTPPNTDKQILNDGKLFTERMILHRSVGVKLEKVEEGGNFSGRIFHPAGDIAYEVLK